jgi:heme A synthase
MTSPAKHQANLPAFRLVAFVALLTWLLLMLGCLVHGTGSSLACPDWPTCYGSFFPAMKNGVEYEHTHRVVATLVGLFTLVAAGLLARSRLRSSRALANYRWAVLAVAAVILQGLLGGITVIYRLPMLVSLSHLALSMGFFSLLVFLAVRLLDWDLSVSVPPVVARLTMVGALVVFTQIVLGGLVRHTHNGLACTSAILCDGELWPRRIGPQIQMLHRFGAVVTASVTVTITLLLLRHTTDVRLRVLALAALGLVGTQLTLGLLSVWWSLDVTTVTLHHGIGALLLATQVVILVVRRQADVVHREVVAPSQVAAET